jgi:hypothetical protein
MFRFAVLVARALGRAALTAALAPLSSLSASSLSASSSSLSSPAAATFDGARR